MNAQELRIGNLVWVEGGELTVHAEDILNIANHTVNSEKVIGIPLTAEWLERFDVYMIPPRGLKYGFQKSIYYVEFSGDSLGWRMLDREYHWIGSEYIRYVHQLQNLYFALTSEELILKP